METEQSEANAVTPTASAPAQSPETTPAVISPTAKAPPKSWADLVRTKAPSSSPAGPPSSTTGALTNGVNVTRITSPGEALGDFSVHSERKICFLEPRGLVNTGNMCYMNSVSSASPKLSITSLRSSRFFKFLFFAYPFTTS